MKTSTVEQLQVLYEIAMSIGTSLNPDQMLRKSLSTLLRRLNCSAGGVLLYRPPECEQGGAGFEEVFTIPRSTAKNQAYQAALHQVPSAATAQQLAKFRRRLPLSGRRDDESYFHILELPDVGLLILTKHGKDLDPIILKSLRPVLAKLAGACNACLQNTALRESEARYRRLFEQTQATLSETQALYRVSRSAISFERLPDLLQAVVDGVAEALSVDRVTLITFDMEAEQVIHFLESGPGAANVVHVPFEELQEGLAGWVLREKRPALSPKGIPDPRESPAVQRRRDETDCGSIIVAPLCYRNNMMGVLTAISRSDQPDFTERDVDLTMALANQAAVAVENARLYHEAQQEIVERRRAEMALRKARDELELRVEERTAELRAANEELERFTYTVSHDLKSPLITIRGFLGFLEQDALAGDLEGVRADVARISGAAEKMQQLLDELLELSRVGWTVNPPQTVHMGELAREVMEMLAGRLETRGVEVDIAPDMPTAYGDRLRLRQVLQNLVDNAVKFMGDQPEPRIEIGARRASQEAIFYVRDNGVGIEPQYEEKVFDLFEKLDSKIEGTGLGLAIVKRIVEMHGGRIWVESEGAGKGSTFCFTLDREGELEA